jgi:hypothetical protein
MTKVLIQKRCPSCCGTGKPSELYKYAMAKLNDDEE